MDVAAALGTVGGGETDGNDGERAAIEDRSPSGIGVVVGGRLVGCPGELCRISAPYEVDAVFAEDVLEITHLSLAVAKCKKERCRGLKRLTEVIGILLLLLLFSSSSLLPLLILV